MSPLDPLELQREVLAYFRSKNYQPPLLPLISVEIMVLSQQSKCRVEDMRKIIERDPLLTARVLERAYARSHQRRFTLPQAMSFLGTERIQGFIFELSLNARIFQSRDYTEALERLRVHSLTTAFIAQRIAQALGLNEQDAFLCGLLHDVGMAGLFILLSKHPSQPTLAESWPIIEEIHAELSGQLARQWRFPRGIQSLLTQHHTPTEKMGWLIALAERFAFEFAPIIGADPSTPEHPQRIAGKDLSSSDVIRTACAKLRVDQRRWGQLRAESARIAQQLFS